MSKTIITIIIIVAVVGLGYWISQSIIKPGEQAVSEESKDCVNNEDCVVFGKDGDCNCGCFNKDNLPSGTGGECFCQAPASCKCVEGRCEEVFNETPDEITDWNSYESKKYGYSFEYPTDCLYGPLPDYCKQLPPEERSEECLCYLNGENPDEVSLGTFTGPKDDLNGASFVVFHSVSVDAYNPPAGTDLVAWLKEHFPYQDVPDRVNIKIDEISAVRVYTPQSPGAYSQEDIYFIKDDKLFRIGLLDVDNEDNRALYDKMLSTFSFIEEEVDDKGQACIDSGGRISISLCCKSTEDYPNLCLIGPCGCLPDNSHQVKICDCGEGKCFNGNTCIAEVYGFNDCIKAGYPAMESYPRQCRTPDGETFTEGEEHCTAPSGESMSLFEAMQIAEEGECGGQLKDYLEFSMCNAGTGTWWIDMDIEKQGCNPACVVNIAEKEAEINWRCTGAIN